MKHLLMLLILLTIPATVRAQVQFDGRSVPCGQLAAVVQSRGAVVISTGSSAYDRYVSGSQFCVRPEIAVPVWISTRDVTQCPVGYVCRDRAAFTGR